MNSTFDIIGRNPHLIKCQESYRHATLVQQSPGSDASDSSDDSSQSVESIASSQTSYSSQEEQWPSSEVQADTREPIGKPISLPAGRYIVPQSQPQHHPRRTSIKEGFPPSLVRQHERKGQFVYHLVDSATYLVETVWPTAAPVCHPGVPQCSQGTLPLRTFIEETLRRSKTSFSTLQVALFYLILLKDHVPAYNFTMEQQQDCSLIRALQCGRRMFLAALILGSKYLQDRNYSARAWSKISGLQVCEINLNERALLAAVNWKLHIPEPTFNCWQDILVKYSNPSMVLEWRRAIRSLTPEYVANYRNPSQTLDVAPSSTTWGSSHSPTVSKVGGSSWAACSPSTVAGSPTGIESQFTMQPPIASTAFKLTTPSPMSSFCPTPAVSIAGDMLRSTSRQRAMCSAMSMASGAANARSCLDLAPSAMGLNGAPGRFNRRSSLASTTSRSSSTSDSTTPSAASSPGSMISDNGSSRSSSISEISSSSQNTSPVRNFLPRLATRNATHKFVDLSAAAAAVSANYDDCVTVLDSEPLSGHNFTASPEVMVIEDDATPTQRSLESIRESRKRHRTSVDMTASSDSALQDQVRMLMRQNLPAPMKNRTMPTFGKKENSFNLGKPAAKKACYMNEVQGHAGFARPEGGPGMWRDILR